MEDSDDEADGEDEELDLDMDGEDEDDEGMMVPFGKMKKWLEKKPRGFGEGKVYDTPIEDQLLDEMQAQVENATKLQNDAAQPNPQPKNNKGLCLHSNSHSIMNSLVIHRICSCRCGSGGISSEADQPSEEEERTQGFECSFQASPWFA